MFKPGTHDSTVIDRMGLAEMIQAGYRFSVQQGHVGFTADSHLVVRDWGTQIGGSTSPVIHLHGGHDAVVGVESVESFAQMHANIEVRLLPDLGQLLLYEQPETVFATLDELISRT